MDSTIKYLQRYYEETPTSFVINGGDMLQSGDTKAQACYNLGYIDGKMHSLFDKYHYVFGNHDNNYQGTNYAGNQVVSSDDLLTPTNIRNLCIRDQENCYYEFKDNSTRYYVFDTGIDWDAASMSDYRWEQVDWFATNLLANNDKHCVIVAHQLHYTGTDLNVLAGNLTKVAQAYNNKVSITLNDKTYDFSNTTGTVHYYLAGHSHEDINTIVNGITCITTANAYALSWSEPTFDLVLADYAANKLHLVRVGSGESRTIDIA
jgi:predicted MPP superfamily phosphohydrolase